MRNKVMVLLLIAAMCFGGCNVIQKDKVAKISVEELANMGYVIYEEKEIIEGIKEIYRGITIDSLTSFAPTMEMIKESMPVENIREYSEGYIIEYPMENKMFVIVTNKAGIRMGSFMRAYEERDEKDIRKIEIGMSEEEVKALFPEVQVSQFLESEIILSNNEIIRIVFEEKGTEKIVKETEFVALPFFESKLEEIMSIEEGKLIQKRTLLVMDNVLIKGEKQLEEFIDRKDKEQVNIVNEKEVLKIKYVDAMEDVEPYECVLQYHNGKYILEDSQNDIKQTFNYIVKLKGKSIVTGSKEEGYYLSNDKDVTYEEVTFNILSSSSIESMDYRQLFLAN